jgi:hypothetical protein
VKQAILPAQGCALKTHRQDCLRHRSGFCGAEASAIQQTGIEPIVDRLADLDFFEIGMLGV